MTQSTDWQTIAETAQEMQLRFMIDLALANRRWMFEEVRHEI